MIGEAAGQGNGLKMILRVYIAQHPFILPGPFENSAMCCRMIRTHQVIAEAARSCKQAILQQQSNTVIRDIGSGWTVFLDHVQRGLGLQLWCADQNNWACLAFGDTGACEYFWFGRRFRSFGFEQ